MLYKIFPTEEEIKKFSLEKIKLIFSAEHKTILFDKFLSPNNQISQNKNSLIHEENIAKKKMQLSNNLYKLIKVCCQNNEENQNYFLKFLGFYSKHIGYGTFVTAALEACLGSNEKILKTLCNYNANNFEDHDNKKSKSFITNILYKFKHFKLYEKADILQLLSKFCSFDEENSVYKNQEIIFQTLNNDENLYFRVFMKIYASNNSFIDRKIYIELGGSKSEKGSSYSMEDILISENKPISEKEIEYLKQQLTLFSNLCLGRNFTCIEYFGNLLPLNVLIKYTLTNNFDDYFRACFCQLIQNIYIDKEPRTILMKPNLVRKVEIRQKEKAQIGFKNPFSMFNKKSRSRSNSPRKAISEIKPDASSFSLNKDENKQLIAEISPAFGNLYFYNFLYLIIIFLKSQKRK